ncbi:MAG TPA: hypothetical protein VGR21_08720 [Cryptosporangiaceae bacterium]|nr:hypothetical protein [Cryptosporangiaceae bacterium]
MSARNDPSADQPADSVGDGSGEPAGVDVPRAVARLADNDLEPGERRRLLGRVAVGAGGGAVRALAGPRKAIRWTLDTLIEVVPHLKVRDLDALRQHHDGKTGDALADALIRNASLVSAGVGAAGGGIAAVEWVAPPTLLSAPILIATETVAVVAVEIKLIAELHEAYGQPLSGSAADRTTALLTAWAQQRGISLLNPARGLGAVLGSGMRKQLRERLLRRMGRNLTTLGPLLTGAAVGAELNRRATRSLGEQVRDDLRRSAPSWVVSQPDGPVLPAAAEHSRRAIPGQVVSPSDQDPSGEPREPR